MTPRQYQLLEILANSPNSPKNRKQLCEILLCSASMVDKLLLKSVKEGLINFQIIDTRKHRASGMKQYVLEPNPRIRHYSLTDLGKQKIKSHSELSKTT